MGDRNTVALRLLAVGGIRHVMTATDELGATDTDSITWSIYVGTGEPVPVILSPEHMTVFGMAPDPVVLKGEAFDHEDGDLPGDRLEWTSSIDGYLGTGKELSYDMTVPVRCGVTYHIITLTARDFDNKVGTDSITILSGIGPC